MHAAMRRGAIAPCGTIAPCGAIVSCGAVVTCGAVVAVMMVLMLWSAGRDGPIAQHKRKTRIDRREHETRRNKGSKEQQPEDEQSCPSETLIDPHRSHRRAGPITISAILDRSPVFHRGN